MIRQAFKKFEPILDLSLMVLGLKKDRPGEFSTKATDRVPLIDHNEVNQVGSARPLVVSRPFILEQSYRRVSSEIESSQCLDIFTEHFLGQFSRRRPLLPELVGLRHFKEFGRFQDGRPYFYFQKPNELGYLIEPFESSWMIFTAHKDSAQTKFIRSSQPWDKLDIYLSQSTSSPEQDQVQLRIDSERFALKKASMLSLERKLIEACLT